MDGLKEIIEEAAAEPAEGSSDMGTFKSRPLTELVEADKYLRAKEAGSSPGRGILITKLRPPGAV